jgi:hypothetical protein
MTRGHVIPPGAFIGHRVYNPPNQFSLGDDGAMNGSDWIMGNTAASLNERHLSASLYRPNDGCVKWTRNPRELDTSVGTPERLVKRVMELGVEKEEFCNVVGFSAFVDVDVDCIAFPSTQ